ncbi:MAG: ABC transporter ATP-binding protein [Magnetovibrionaceae bacterium]
MPEQPKIQLNGVCKAFNNGTKKVLDGVDLSVAKGESVAIIGGSGTGKSVTLKCILGLLAADSGEILIDGEDVLRMRKSERARTNRQIGMLFQGAALFDSLPVWENVAFGLLAEKRCSRSEAKDRAVERLNSVGLSADLLDRYPAELSGGMQKRVGLARAIAIDPEIIFYDEPTTGLDPIMADVINNLIAKTTREVGATALSITHDMASVRKIADKVAMLYQGRIIWFGPVSEIESCGQPHVNQFINGLADGPITQGLPA